MPTPVTRRDTVDTRVGNPAAPRELLPVLLLVVTAWSLLATQALLSPRVGRPAAVLIAFVAVTALVLATRQPARQREPTRAGVLFALGALAGCVSFPVWIHAIGVVGRGIGMLPVSPPPRPDDPLLLIAVLGFAPIFEELLYRERLLLALHGRLGSTAALVLSSVCFALPHLEPWSLLATGLVGFGLGWLMLTGRSVALCIGLHAGLNLAAVVCGVPPIRFVLPGIAALLAGMAILAAGLFVARRRVFGVVAASGH